MSKKSNKQQLQALDEQIETAVSNGDRATAAGLHGQKALLYTLALDFRNAAKEVAKAGVLAEEDGQVDVVAQSFLTEGKALMQAGQAEAAADLLHKAAALFSTLELPAKEAESLAALAGLALANEDAAEGLSLLQKAAVLLSPNEQPAQLINLYQQQAILLWAVGEAAKAQAALDKAQAVASQQNDESAKLVIETQKIALQETADSDTLAKLFNAAQRNQQPDLLSDIQLQQATAALDAGHFEEARRTATAARNAARDTDDFFSPVRYLAASVVMADVAQQQGDDAAVLAAWLTCRTYLQHALGPDLGQQIDRILNTLQQTWGQRRMAAAVAEYRRRAAEEGPYEA